MSELLLRDVFSIRGRFHRSVQLERDWREQRGLNDYLATPTTRELSAQMLAAAHSTQGPKAWSITGPYGSGKSAFALFLADLLANRTPEHEQAKLLRDEISSGEQPFVPVLIVGQRKSLLPALLDALHKTMSSIDPEFSQQVLEDAGSENNSNKRVAETFEQSAQIAMRHGHDGLLVIVDEFGKFLEYAAQHPESEDLIILQELAEMAARSEVPIVIVTILHSAFDEYLGTLNKPRRGEWQKVQGRFVDVAFLEPPEQFLRLVGAAIQNNGSSANIARQYFSSVKHITDTTAADESRRRMSLRELLPDCAPLHPWTALLLWPLFRSKLAQNERSLFAFLIDQGPFGFQEFLSVTTIDLESPPFYRVDQLYDYVTTTLGPAALLGNQAHRWAEIAHAVNRVPATAPRLSRAIVKTIGLLGLYGAPVGLRPSEETLKWAFHGAKKVLEAIDYLDRSSIIVYRRYESAYGLWEGSDVDLEETYERALYHVGKGHLAARLKKTVTMRPQVAKAYYIRSGTLRYFIVDVIDGVQTSIKASLETAIGQADGRITFVLTTDKTERELLIDYAVQLTSDNKAQSSSLQVLAFPKPMVGLERALLEVEAWNWVSENTQELQGDPVAKREVKSRIALSQRRLQDIAGQVLNLRGYLFNPAASSWIQDGELQELKTVIDFQKWLTQLCDNVYYKTPTLHNELLNRERLSSAATAARRVLVESMIESETLPQLGITGTPAEYSMYRAMLAEGGFHRQGEEGWYFTAPENHWRQAWTETDEFLNTTAEGRRPIVELINTLKSPPFGLREGPIPVLICAFLLAHGDEIALYEDGLFIPEIRIQVFERLIRMPKTFEIQKHRLTRAEREAFVAVAGILESLRLSTNLTSESDLLSVVRPLVVFAAQMPDYSKRTKRIEPNSAISIREALLNARDPYKLMFQDLPKTLDASIGTPDEVAEFADRLKDALLGLQRAYRQLLDNIENQLRSEFGLNGNSAEARKQLRERATPLIGFSAERVLALFIREASNIDKRDWREVLARVVNKGIPPTHWVDADVVDFQVRVRQISSDFVRLEELVAEKRLSGVSNVLRIGWLDGQLQEARAVIAIPHESNEHVEELATQIEELLREFKDTVKNRRQVQLAAIAKVAQRYLQDPEERTYE